MGIKAHYLQTTNGDKFYPYSHADASYDKNGVTVGTRLDELDNNKVSSSDLTAEVERASAKETELENLINAEIERATNSENTIANDLAEEITRATTIHSEMNSAITEETNRAESAESVLETSISSHISDKSNPHETNAEQVGLGNVDNTADVDKPVSTAQQKAIDLAYQNATAYADKVKSDIMGGLPSESLDTITELAEKLQDDSDALSILIETVSEKAEQDELDTHVNNDTIHITSTERTNWNDANSKKHTHSNESILNNTTASYTTDEKTKLSGIATGAEVNQNAFSNVVIGSTTISADSKTDTLTLVAGSNVTLTPDATNDKITIAATDTNTKVTQTVTTTNASYPLLLAPSGQTATTTTTSYFDSGVTLNPSTNTIVANVSGSSASCTGNSATATKATQDGNGNVITSTYLPLSGGTISGNLMVTGYISGEAVRGTTTNHAILIGHANQDYCNFYEYGGLFQFYKSMSGTNTLLGKITTNGWEGNVKGNVTGNVTGNASTATKLATARTIALTGSVTGSGSFDGSGNLSIATTTNHTHGLLNSDFTVTINSSTDSGWSMINSSYDGFLLKSIRTETDAPNWILSNYSAGIAFGGSDTKGVISCSYYSPSIKFAGGNGTKPTWNMGLTGTSGTTYNLNNFSTSSHTHNYAGSSSAGGSATSAVKLDTSTAGSATQPVYFSSGKPVACTYTLGKSVPSNAVFTDTNTTYSAGTGISLSSTTFSLASSGVTAGSYGQSADASPSHSGTFSVPYITVDTYGRVTSASTKTITLPSDNNTDTKVTISANAPTSATSYYPTMYTSTSGTTAVTANANVKYSILTGTASAAGNAYLILGNSTASGKASNSTGYLRLYSASTSYHTISPASTSSAITHTLPATTGTILNSGTTSFTQTLTSGTAIGTIKINGSSKTLYAPNSVATTSADGLMSSSDKSKLDSLGSSWGTYTSIYSTKFYPDSTGTISKTISKIGDYTTIVVHATIGEYERQYVFRRTQSLITQGFSYYKSASYFICGVIYLSFSTNTITMTVSDKAGWTNASNCYISSIYGYKF